MQDHQCRVHHALTSHWHILHIVLCEVPRSEGVEVCAKLHTNLLKVLNHSLAWVGLCTVECHMLKEVSQALLVVILLNSTHIVYDVEVSHTLWLLVVTDVVGESVLKFTDANRLVSRDRLLWIDLRKGC